MANFTISNAAGGSERSFRLVKGRLSAAALRHAHACAACGGPEFAGADGEQARQAWEAWWEEFLDGDHPEWEARFQGRAA